MTGRVAIVTGGGRGIGAATVARLAETGWHVLAVDRGVDDPRLPYALASAADLEAVVGAANEAAGTERVRAELADASDFEAMTAVVARAEQWGALEAVVANAGAIAGGVPAWELAPGQEQAVIDACLTGVMVTARAGVPALLRRPAPRAARFVAVTSTAAVRGMTGLAAYCAAKAGANGFVRALAADLRGTGITANAVAPGATDTTLLTQSAALYELAAAEEFARQQPIERLVEPGEVAALIDWLLGPRSDAITGASLAVDGGLSI